MVAMHHVKSSLFAIIIIAACAHINWATAQNGSQTAPKAACIVTKDIKAPQLYGLWQVSFTNPPAGLPDAATVMLEKHEEFSDSLQGVVTRKLPAGQKFNAKDGHAAKAALALSPGAWNAIASAPLAMMGKSGADFGDRLHKFADTMLPAADCAAMYRSLVSHWRDPARVVLGATEPAGWLQSEAVQFQGKGAASSMARTCA